MSKWVTFYWDMLGGISDMTEHDDKDTATRYFKRHYRNYFQLSGPFNATLPCSYGYGHRKFFGMSKQMFNKKFGTRNKSE